MITLEFPSAKLHIAANVVSIFHEFSRPEGDAKEAGGILLGQVTEDSREILICRASIPSDRDKSSRSSFRRNRSAAQHIVTYEFHNSRGRNTYLGEWHTHDSAMALPSAQDHHMIEEQIRKNSVPAGRVVMIVVAHDQLYVALLEGTTLTSRVIGGLSDAPIRNGLG